MLDQLGVDSAEAYDQLDQAEKAAHVRKAEDELNRSIWLINDRYSSEGQDGPLHQAAQGQPFINEDGSLKTDMTNEEEQGFREWATDSALVGGTEDPGPLYEDKNHGLDAGMQDVISASQGAVPDLEGRR